MLRIGTETSVRVVILAWFWYFSHLSVAPALEWVQQAKLTADDATFADFFGISVSMSGGTAIVGACGDDENGDASGSVYIYERSDTAWTQTPKLLADHAAPEDRFGYTVSISGNAAIVGVDPDEDIYGNQGWVYIFQREDTGWTQVYKSPRWNGYFGRSVAIDGSIAIVGAPESRDDDLPDGRGNAYIFEETDSGWTNIARLQPDDSRRDDRFGNSVSVHGDTLLIGAAESAYVFERADAGWTQVAKLLAEDGQPGDMFGLSVSVAPGTAIVGVERDDDNGDRSGSAYIFEESESGWSQVAKLLASDGQRNDFFGRAVSLDASTALVGAPTDGYSARSGSAYLFEETDSGWTQIAKLLPTDPNQVDIFGFSVSMSDGTALIGAPGDDSLFQGAGAAYVFVVPEPSSVALLVAAGAGLLIFTLLRRR